MFGINTKKQKRLKIKIPNLTQNATKKHQKIIRKDFNVVMIMNSIQFV